MVFDLLIFHRESPMLVALGVRKLIDPVSQATRKHLKHQAPLQGSNQTKSIKCRLMVDCWVLRRRRILGALPAGVGVAHLELPRTDSNPNDAINHPIAMASCLQ